MPASRPPEQAEERALLARLRAPDRDATSGAFPVVPVDERETRATLEAIERFRSSGARLDRRGAWHGEWAELDPRRLPRGPWSVFPEPGAFAARWHAARPVVLPGVAHATRARFQDEIAAADALHARLGEPGELRRFVRERIAGSEERFELTARAAPLFDPERDLERVFVAAHPPPGAARARRIQDLWLKSSWLSTFDGEDSLRVRVSFGREVRDDASRDLLRQRLTAELAERVFPAAALVSDDPVIVPLVERCTNMPVLFTQHIAYWNAPGGGALFHHDAFAEDADAGPGQLGVCYLQLSGRTAWLALSIDDLARRVAGFGALLAAGELGWVRAQLFPKSADWTRFERLVAEPDDLVQELGHPGCGALGALVNRGPEFTGWLALHGHAAFLGPGDAILLPNHGLDRTCMHSVFCAGEERAFSLSVAVRADVDEA